MKKQHNRKSYGGRVLSSLLVLCLLFGMLTPAALAVNSEPEGEAVVECTQDEGCAAETHDESCPLYGAPAPEEESADKDALIPAGPTAAEQVAVLIAALPEYGDVTPEDVADIEAAQAAYDALTIEELAEVDAELVSKLADLTELAADIKVILAEAEDNGMVNYSNEVELTVTSEADLRSSLTNDEYIGKTIIISIANDVELSDTIEINNGIRTILLQSISANVFKIKATDDFRGDTLFKFGDSVGSCVELTLKNIIIDVNQKGRGFGLSSPEAGKDQHCLILDAGSVIENAYSTNYTSGGISLTSADLQINGGTIQNCTSTKASSGGAVTVWDKYNTKRGHIVMNDGLITGCSGTYAGGINAPWGGNISLLGGSITENYRLGSTTNFGGGILFGMNAGDEIKFVIGGDADVSHNYARSKDDSLTSEDERNVYLNLQSVDQKLTVFINNEFSRILSLSISTYTGTPGDYLSFHIDDGSAELLNQVVIKSTTSENALFMPYLDNGGKVEIAPVAVITFNDNIGEQSESHTQNVPQNIATNLADNGFTREGYTFNGWSTNPSGGDTTYPDGANITVSDNTTLYAQWKANEYAITYELNGGTAGANAPGKHIYGTATTLVPPTREGYTFAGWFIDSDLPGSKVESLGATDYTDNITLYAKWTPNTYTISFYGGEGAGGTTANVSATYDTPATLTANGFTKSGSNFAGWTATSGGTVVEYSDGAQVLNLTAEANGTITLYAVWTTKTVLTPDVTVQTKTYNGTDQAFALEGGYTTAYQQDGQTATPKDAGTYDVVISAAETDTTAAYKSTVYGGLVITPATLTIKADNKSVYVGDAIPEFTYTLSGLAGADTESVITTAPTLACDAENTNTAGGYTITPSGADAGSNYTITYVDGTLTVSSRSSGGGGGGGGGSSTSGVSGSGGSVSVSAGGGTVSNSQMTAAVNKASEGAVIEIKAASSTAVSLPVSGMEKAAANDNDVTIATRNGEVTLSAAAIEGLVEGASSNQAIQVSVTTATASAAGVEAGTPVFDVSVTVGNKTVHSFDGSLTVTLTVSNLSKIENPHVLHILTDGTKQYLKPTVSGNQLTVSGIRNLSYFAVIPGSQVPAAPEPLPFTDVAEDFWAYGAISYVYEKGLFAGTSETMFSPNLTMTREMLWTVLGRLSGAELSGENVFQQARQWAMASGVSDGTNGGGAITREQMVTMLYGYAGHPAASGDLSGYADASSVSGYAADAMAWAVDSGIISGTSADTLSPQGSATRAQVAMILMRFIEHTDK